MTSGSVSAIAFSPLEQGILTDKYLEGLPEDSRAVRDGRYLKKEHITGEKVSKAQKLNSLAIERGQSLAQMSIAWLLKDPRITSVLVGASKSSQILDNIRATDNIDFSEQELSRIEEILK